MLYVYNLLFCYSYFMVFGFGKPVINLAGFFCLYKNFLYLW